MKVYIVIEPITKEQLFPKIIGVFKDKNKADEIASKSKSWGNVVTFTLQ